MASVSNIDIKKLAKQTVEDCSQFVRIKKETCERKVRKQIIESLQDNGLLEKKISIDLQDLKLIFEDANKYKPQLVSVDPIPMELINEMKGIIDQKINDAVSFVGDPGYNDPKSVLRQFLWLRNLLKYKEAFDEFKKDAQAYWNDPDNQQEDEAGPSDRRAELLRTIGIDINNLPVSGLSQQQVEQIFENIDLTRINLETLASFRDYDNNLIRQIETMKQTLPNTSESLNELFVNLVRSQLIAAIHCPDTIKIPYCPNMEISSVFPKIPKRPKYPGGLKKGKVKVRPELLQGLRDSSGRKGRGGVEASDIFFLLKEQTGGQVGGQANYYYQKYLNKRK